MPAAADADLFLAPCGMNALWAAFRAAAGLQAARGRPVWLQLGWLYLDTIAILQRFTGATGNHIHVRDPLDLEAIARLLTDHPERIAGVIDGSASMASRKRLKSWAILGTSGTRTSGASSWDSDGSVTP